MIKGLNRTHQIITQKPKQREMKRGELFAFGKETYLDCQKPPTWLHSPTSACVYVFMKICVDKTRPHA